MVDVKTKFERPNREEMAALAQYGSATIHEAQGRRGAVHSSIKPIDRDMRLCGSIVTVQCAPRDNLMLQVAISYAQAGDVLVVSTGGDPEAGFFGEVLATACVAQGIAGLVIDSGVRDTTEIRQLGFPVFSKGIAITGTVKETVGPINHPMVFGGLLVNPGDAIKGDADGLVVVARAEVADVARVSGEREAEELITMQRYREGASTIELCRLEEKLALKQLSVEGDG
jgi:4-hydroxy-4-methyl-2-oxoglutarate aldolase